MERKIEWALALMICRLILHRLHQGHDKEVSQREVRLAVRNAQPSEETVKYPVLACTKDEGSVELFILVRSERVREVVWQRQPARLAQDSISSKVSRIQVIAWLEDTAV